MLIYKYYNYILMFVIFIMLCLSVKSLKDMVTYCKRYAFNFKDFVSFITHKQNGSYENDRLHFVVDIFYVVLIFIYIFVFGGSLIGR